MVKIFVLGGRMKYKQITNDLIRQRLVEQIKFSGLTQAKIAKEIGVKPSTISQYKINKMPSLETFSKLCQVLDCDANYILGLTDN